MTLWWTEARLQWRSGFALAYAIVGTTYVAGLAAVPDPVVDRILPSLLFADPAMLGLFAMGARVLLERQQGATNAWALSPVSPHRWLAAKVGPLTALALAVASAVAIGLGRCPRPDLLLLAVVPTSAMCTCVGAALVSRTRTFNQYLAVVAVGTAPLALPLVEAFGPPVYGLSWFPTGPTFRLLEGATGAHVLPATSVVQYVLVELGWTVLAWVWAARWTRRHLWARGSTEVA